MLAEAIDTAPAPITGEREAKVRDAAAELAAALSGRPATAAEAEQGEQAANGKERRRRASRRSLACRRHRELWPYPCSRASATAGKEAARPRSPSAEGGGGGTARPPCPARPPAMDAAAPACPTASAPSRRPGVPGPSAAAELGVARGGRGAPELKGAIAVELPRACLAARRAPLARLAACRARLHACAAPWPTAGGGRSWEEEGPPELERPEDLG